MEVGGALSARSTKKSESTEAVKKRKQREKTRVLIDHLLNIVLLRHSRPCSHQPQKFQGKINSLLLDTIDVVKQALVLVPKPLKGHGVCLRLQASLLSLTGG